MQRARAGGSLAIRNRVESHPLTPRFRESQPGSRRGTKAVLSAVSSSCRQSSVTTGQGIERVPELVLWLVFPYLL